MPDFTMCQNSDCPLNLVCHRFIATPNKFAQSYSYFEPFLNDKKKIDCEHFKPIPEQDESTEMS